MYPLVITASPVLQPPISLHSLISSIPAALKIALSTAIKFLNENPNSFDLILWVLDEKTYAVYKEKYKKLVKI